MKILFVAACVVFLAVQCVVNVLLWRELLRCERIGQHVLLLAAAVALSLIIVAQLCFGVYVLVYVLLLSGAYA